jgi:hypothetical protein
LLHGNDLLHGDAPDDHGVEAVEGAEDALHQPAAFRRIGIGIGHVGEIRRQCGLAMHGDGVALLRRRLAAVQCRREENGEGAAHQRAYAAAHRNWQQGTLI